MNWVNSARLWPQRSSVFGWQESPVNGRALNRRSLPGALLRFRIMAWVTGVVLGALTIWLVVGYGFLDYANTEVKPDLYRWLWTAHGWLYLFYLIAGVDLCFRIKLSVIKTLAVLLAGTVPFMSFVADFQLHKYVRSHHLEPMPPAA
jgi:integral membrane protein